MPCKCQDDIIERFKRYQADKQTNKTNKSTLLIDTIFTMAVRVTKMLILKNVTQHNHSTWLDAFTIGPYAPAFMLNVLREWKDGRYESMQLSLIEFLWRLPDRSV